MGYLTTFTIYNDGAYLVKDNPKEFAEKIHQAITSNSPSSFDIAINNFANLVRVQKPRHADDHTVYVHMGNCVAEVNAHSDETKKMMKNNPKFFKKLLDEMSYQLKELKKEFDSLESK